MKAQMHKLDSIVNKEVAEKLQSGEINEKSITQCYVQWYDSCEYKSMALQADKRMSCIKPHPAGRPPR